MREYVRFAAPFAAVAVLTVCGPSTEIPVLRRAEVVFGSASVCRGPWHSKGQFTVPIYEAAQAAWERGESEIGESLMGCPPAEIDNALISVLDAPLNPLKPLESLQEHQGILNIILDSRAKVEERRRQVSEGVI